MKSFELSQKIKNAVGIDAAKWITCGTNGVTDEVIAIYVQQDHISNWYNFQKSRLLFALQECNIRVPVKEIGSMQLL